jgi:hypothetical protein
MLEANKIPTNNTIWKYSNPKTSQKRAFRFFGKNAVIYKSTKKNKKYMIKKPTSGTFVHFGQIPYEDFTKHKNTKRRQNYLNRSLKIRGDWKKDKYSANNLARKILW